MTVNLIERGDTDSPRASPGIAGDDENPFLLKKFTSQLSYAVKTNPAHTTAMFKPPR